ncbi:E3 ubiquitin/ISG15 ligase TRIM25-like [Hyla sarda]|uniref:E3 ubiquitin/ISG15 ligase TRIM25-like n=1 Tax=Hyla sarda TaxID=327740 RepID=UPI0024C23FCB|nr:E3 ubiquitin/ISG15 ligase TRIM25-like [Hyla sarda]XP_056390683.1 E3 ubiquitin/ISG15 ligase TRIM25-like [Hyla sarda]
MASSDLRDEQNCSICLSIYTDPVSLRCGHNFCRSCIVQVLNTQDGSGGYTCPDCREEYPERPTLEQNKKLGNIVEESRFFCSYCVKSPVAAVKSCLQCENSLCDAHLKVHNKTMDHKLAEPTGSFDNKKCPIHKKVLEYYCPQDAACLCVSCCLVGKHGGHQVELLEEASKKKKKRLHKNLEELNSRKAEIQTRVQNLHDHQKNMQKKASDKRRNIIKLFLDIKKQLEKAEMKAMREISRQEKKIVSQISVLVRKLEIEEDKLFRKMRRLEEMCHVTDPIRFLQENYTPACDHGDGADTEGDSQKIKSLDNSDVQVSDTKVWSKRTDENMVIQESGHGVACSAKSMAAEEAALVSDFHKIDNLDETSDDLDETSVDLDVTFDDLDETSDDLDGTSDDLGGTTDALDETADDLDEILISLTIHRSMLDIITNVPSELGFQVSDILLDVATAEAYLEVSEDMKTVREVGRQKKIKSPLRFIDFAQVLGRCSLSSGRHFWEVEWNQIGRCDFGMSYPSIRRKGDRCGIGQNDKSWGIAAEELECFSVIHNNVSKTLDLEPMCSTFGVFLDYEAGRLSFYEMSDRIRHVHTFTASFTEPLHALFGVYNGASLTITT